MTGYTSIINSDYTITLLTEIKTMTGHALYLKSRTNKTESWGDADIQPVDIFPTRPEAERIKEQEQKKYNPSLCKLFIKKERM